MSLLLVGCGRGSSSETVATTCSPTVNLSSNASSIYESASGTISIKATLSCAASENVVVTLGTSGTATEGTDYSNLSNITITAGSTTESTSFDPTSDSTYESSNETAIISITGVSGGGASESGNQSVTITINEYALNSGTQLTYNSTNATTLANTSEFKNFRYASGSSSQNPLEVINAHKAYGYGLTGSGEIIAILDSGFSSAHLELNSSGKIIEFPDYGLFYGTIDAATGNSVTDDHGLFVSSIAAGEDDGTGMQGVAPGAKIHISDYSLKNGNTYYPTQWANATDDAAENNAVVQNNSWGATNATIATVNNYKANNSLTSSAALAAYFTAASLSSDESSVNTYVESLNNFQDKGVVVFALSNTSSLADADAHAALPEFYSQLAEAWITAVNVEITGSSGNETYTRKSAPCGSTGAYCLGSDGWQINGAGWTNAGNAYWQGASGTSFVAPQISGSVALLAEAFPNHTPEQLTDRLLASADNSFFNHDAVVTFGNGISHGYDDEFGHGILDIYAALRPITSSSDNRSSRIFTGNTLSDDSVFQLGNSRLLTSSSFGDSILRGLSGKIGYTYDDLDGGFKYDLSSHVFIENKGAPSLSLATELNNLSNPIKKPLILVNKNNFKQVAGSVSFNDKLNTSLTLGGGSFPVQNFFGLNNDTLDLLEFQTPYLESNEGGVGVNADYQLSNSRLLLGITVPIEKSNGQTLGLRKSLLGSLEFGEPSSQLITLMAGVAEDKDSLLGSSGTNAFSLDGSKSITTFALLKAQKQLNDDFSLTGIATFGNTNMSSPSNSFIDSASDVKSSGIGIIANMSNLSKDDSLSVYINQPNRIDDGSMAIKIASLADSRRNIDQTIKNINLDSSARQVNMGFSYRKNLSEDLTFSFKHLITNNINHSDTSNKLHSSYVGMDYKDLKLGISSNPNDFSIEKQISYAVAL
ncbi:S8 family serine peptidase [Candidatus Pseudothioglobus sp. Uisw_086]|uniref:S8 family serine peptidase n=1 Tax=Candidatus Pseudothioglobus sp. Uisw_086 TaxID=3230998 RepID=UPI003A875A51